MDTQPDQATCAVLDAMRQSAARNESAVLLFVEFSHVSFWRRIPQLSEHIEQNGLRMYGLEPRSITIVGERFDLIAHFRSWRERDEAAMVGFRYAADVGLRAALDAEPAGTGRWKRVAERLSRDGIKTVRGGAWTPEDVRKLVGKLP